MALNPVDKLLAGYLGFVSLLIVVRGDAFTIEGASMLAMHALFAVLLFLFTRLEPGNRLGTLCHDLYPIAMLLPLYAEIGLLNPPPGDAGVLAHDSIIQGWEATVFGSQVSYTWIRNAPSVFWSGVLHFAYFSYYAIILLGPVAVWLRGFRDDARHVVLAMTTTFVFCYLWFVLFPVAGPYYAFAQPTGAVREVWSARLVYAVLAGGSSFGAAFPSSHVGATVATTLAILQVWRPLGWWFVPPTILLTVGTVYCQQHYGIDASAGLMAGVLGFWLAGRIRSGRLSGGLRLPKASDSPHPTSTARS